MLIGPVVAQIDHASGVSVSAAGFRSAAGCFGFVAPPGMVANVANIVSMVGDRLDVVVRVFVKVTTALPMVSATLNHVPQMRNHTRCDKRLTFIIEINAPGITGSIGEGFEDVFRGVITPHRAVHGDTLLVGFARSTHFRVGEHTVATVEPAIGAPDECVQRFVSVMPSKTVSQNDRAFGHIAGKLKVCLRDTLH